MQNIKPECPICYEEQYMIILPVCGHVICDICITKLIICPICRYVYDMMNKYVFTIKFCNTLKETINETVFDDALSEYTKKINTRIKISYANLCLFIDRNRASINCQRLDKIIKNSPKNDISLSLTKDYKIAAIKTNVSINDGQYIDTIKCFFPKMHDMIDTIFKDIIEANKNKNKYIDTYTNTNINMNANTNLKLILKASITMSFLEIKDIDNIFCKNGNCIIFVNLIQYYLLEYGSDIESLPKINNEIIRNMYHIEYCKKNNITDIFNTYLEAKNRYKNELNYIYLSSHYFPKHFGTFNVTNIGV